MSREIEFLDGSEAPVRFSDRKLRTKGDDMPWPLEELVEAQRMDCELVPREEIAERMGRTVAEVNRKLDPPNAAPRQERTGVGFAALKGR